MDGDRQESKKREMNPISGTHSVEEKHLRLSSVHLLSEVFFVELSENGMDGMFWRFMICLRMSLYTACIRGCLNL